MKKDLTPANSDLIALIESQLLWTELHVNDNENITMADDLLDLELDTMSLSQSTRLDTVFRVPYKKMHDSQTSNSRMSSELCCKDQIRSNNNSAFLDTARSPNYDDLPLMEIVYDREPSFTVLSNILLAQHSWVTEAPRHFFNKIRAMTTAPPAGCFNSTSLPLAVSESMSRNTTSPPSVSVVNTATTETTYFATRGQWNATLEVFTTWISHTFLPFSTSSSHLYPIPTVMNGCDKDSLLPAPSHLDLALHLQDPKDLLSFALHPPRTDCALA